MENLNKRIDLKKVLLLLNFLFVAIAFSQERINVDRVPFQEKSETISTAEGWYLYDGTWRNERNTIPLNNSRFITLRFRTLNYKGASYFVFTTPQSP